MVAKRTRAASNVSNASSNNGKKVAKTSSAKAVPASKKKPAKKADSSSDEDSSEDEKPTKKAAAKKMVVSDSENSDSDSDERPVRKNSNSSRRKSSAAEAELEETKEAPVASNPEDAEKTELFIKSLSYDVDEDTLRNHFGQHGNLVKVKMIMSNGQFKGIAFVEYDTHESAAKAIAAENGNDLCGRTMGVEYSGGKP